MGVGNGCRDEQTEHRPSECAHASLRERPVVRDEAGALVVAEATDGGAIAEHRGLDEFAIDEKLQLPIVAPGKGDTGRRSTNPTAIVS